mgnify:CR=1 FL=1
MADAGWKLLTAENATDAKRLAEVLEAWNKELVPPAFPGAGGRKAPKAAKKPAAKPAAVTKTAAKKAGKPAAASSGLSCMVKA